MTPTVLAALLRSTEIGESVVLATRLADGAQFLLPALEAPLWLQDQAAASLAQDRSIIAEHEGERWFLHVHAPTPRLLIVGAVHIAQALTPLAAMTGLDVTIIDPRRGFADPARFPGFTVQIGWPDDAIQALKPDRRTAIVALSHDPKLDDPALDTALGSDAFFVGALGSRKSHAARLARLRARGIPQEALHRIRGPVGLAIGAVTASEIALSILAEIIAVRRHAALGVRSALALTTR